MGSASSAQETMWRNIESSTGISQSEWIATIRGQKLHKHGAIVKWLKSERGLTHGYANFIALQSRAPADAGSDDDRVAGLFSGRKAGLRQLYDRLVNTVRQFGEVEVVPKKANVSFRRRKQFALLQPSTADRLDVGLILRGAKPTARLERAGSFNSMCTHRVRLTSPKQIDQQFKAWLKEAYDAAE